jgi:hypothetical protein
LVKASFATVRPQLSPSNPSSSVGLRPAPIARSSGRLSVSIVFHIPRRRGLRESRDLRGTGVARRSLTRLAANESLEWEIAELLFRPSRHTSRKPLVRHKSFSTRREVGRSRGGSWRKSSTMSASCSRVSGSSSRASTRQSSCSPVLQQTRQRRAMDQGSQRSQTGGVRDAPVVSSLPSERSPAAVERASLQLRESVAAARATERIDSWR